MNMSEFFKPVTLIALAVGSITGGIITFTLSDGGGNESATASNEDKPLYWVAPMDPNYRRDKPGQSPMGMDLIPVYDNAKSANDAGPGTIKVEPHVVNNLGVRIATVEKKALKEKIFTVGYVKFDENKLIHIHPRVSGWVDKLYVKSTGDPVSAGQALYSLYSPELVNAQEELILALNRNNSRLIQAAEDRLNALQIPVSFVEKLKRNKSVEQSIVFYSPQDGVIDNLNIREGFYVQPGTTLFSIGALDKVWVEAEVFERQAALVKKGDRVTMNLDYLPGTTWDGEVDYIYPTLDSKTRTIRLRLKFDNAEKKLLPNMFAQVVIHSESSEDLLLIPREALIQTGNQDRVVLALGEGSFKSIEVTTGREDQDNVEILVGLNEGDEVVSSAQFLLDSESSKTSDFMRMNPESTAEQDKSESVWIAAVINKKIFEERIVSASHEAIEAWNMMAMTMNFSVSDDVDFNVLTPGTELHMEIKMGNSGMYEIIGTHIMSAGSMRSEEDKPSTEDLSDPNHDDMDHSKMDHGEMDHSNMDHSQMSHGEMDHTNHQQHADDGE
ncbi:efflux RND transporter periplasmic adaptor subunit [Saccharophagus degradans]|uniref:efflux RND transporter periplasmic adaptor subunit n=1 Tax=Saccharophagus degradans TaxID=86304 RepID=UPI002477F9D5|nr:efflux RND transporter periplasmic adaptor subunit [Saccharophagus degradans]WGO96879.1 efflux RND transporter periplasmic adaptor subunit [Saccharophagus degradans]